MTGPGGRAAVAGVVAITAVILWPARPRPAADSRRSAPEEAAATIYDVADAATLLAVVLGAGLGPVEALEVVGGRVGGPVGHELTVVAAAHRWGEDPEAAWSHVGAAWQPISHAWRAAIEAGAAPAALVEVAAGRLRDDEDRRLEAAVERAGVLLVLPLGLAFLPGFVGTTIVPVVLHLMRSLVG